MLLNPAKILVLVEKPLSRLTAGRQARRKYTLLTVYGSEMKLAPETKIEKCEISMTDIRDVFQGRFSLVVEWVKRNQKHNMKLLPRRYLSY